MGENDSKTILVSAILLNKDNKTNPFSNKNGYLWTGPLSPTMFLRVNYKASSCKYCPAFVAISILNYLLCVLFVCSVNLCLDTRLASPSQA